MIKASASGAEDQGWIPDQVKPKKKMVVMRFLLGAQDCEDKMVVMSFRLGAQYCEDK